MLQQRLMWILWPAFLMAGVTEMLVFAMIDPQDLSWLGQPLGWSRQSVYTVAFFVFWVILAVSGSLTTLLSMSPFEVNRCPLPEKKRADNCPKKDGV
jgi:hypothetical protein